MEKLKKYIEDLFKEYPKTKKTRELKEELLADLSEKYNDLIKEGKSENDAYQEIISSIGDIDEIINTLNEQKNTTITNNINNEQKKKTALIVSISVGLYFIALIATCITDEINMPDYLSGTVFLGIAGLATCLLIYHFMSMPKYKKEDDTIVEEFKEWKSSKDQKAAIKKSINSIIWTFIVIVYLLISFLFGIWYISWILFIVGGLIEAIVNLIFQLGGD